LLTELTIRALKELRPKLLMVNYQDCDYVHWGNITHYTRAISVMDDGLKQIVAAVEADPEYRENTIFVVVPGLRADIIRWPTCLVNITSNSRSAHEIFALVVGPGLRKSIVVDKPTDQISIAGTLLGSWESKPSTPRADIREAIA